MTLPIPTNGWSQLWLFIESTFLIFLNGSAFYAAVKNDNDQLGKWTISVLVIESLFFGGYLQGLQSKVLKACATSG